MAPTLSRAIGADWTLAPLAGILGIAILAGNGALWAVCVAGLALLAAVFWRDLSKPGLLLLPSIALLQFVPGRTATLAPAATLIHLARFIGYSLMFELVRRLDRGMGDRPRWRLLIPILAVAVVEALVCLWQAQRLPVHDYAGGTYQNHNHAAGLLAMALPVAAAWFFFASRPVGATLFLILGAGLVATMSRGGVVAGAAGVLVVGGIALARARTSATRLATAGLALAGIAGGLLLLPHELRWRFSQYATFEGWRDDVRVAVWHDAFGVWLKRPLLGCGFGAFSAALPTPHNGHVWEHCDNDYLQILAESGVAGASAVALAIGAPIRASLRNLTSPGVAALGGISALLVHALSDSNLYTFANALVLAWLLAVAQTNATSHERNTA